jgi:hypothetical protein
MNRCPDVTRNTGARDLAVTWADALCPILIKVKSG